MKTLVLVGLWGAAIGCALWLWMRSRRGRPVVLRGRRAPRFVRMVVLALVALGVSAQVAADEPDAPPAHTGQPAADVPTALDAHTMRAWRRMALPFLAFRRAYARWRMTGEGDPLARRNGGRVRLLSEGLRRLVAADVDAQKHAASWPEQSATGLLAVLDEAEHMGFVDAWTAAYLWRWTRTLPQPAAGAGVEPLTVLLTRLRRHARLANALIKAKAEVKPIDLPPRAWMSKAGPKVKAMEREQRAQQDLLESAQQYYPQVDAAPLGTETAVHLRVHEDADALVWHRTGGATIVQPGAKLTFGRLDLMVPPAAGTAVVHAWLGRIELPAMHAFRVWDLPGTLSTAAHAIVKAALTRALRGDAQAALQLESALPFVAPALRAALTAQPGAQGAPRLRMLLAAFE